MFPPVNSVKVRIFDPLEVTKWISEIMGIKYEVVRFYCIRNYILYFMKHILNNTKVSFPATVLIIFMILSVAQSKSVVSQTLHAGAGKVNITAGAQSGQETDNPLVHDSLYAKALIIENDNTKAVIIAMDVITIHDRWLSTDNFLTGLRKKVQDELGIRGENVLVNASHNHRTQGQVCKDLMEKTFLAVKKAAENIEPITVGVGSGYEDRISMNRRLQLKNGKAWTIRHANPSPPDEEVAGVGPMDPEIGILKLNRLDGTTKAVVYNFAVHPYSGVPEGGATAELPGFASEVIEDQLGEDALALFVQGAGGNITEVLYKVVNQPMDCEPLGRMLGLSTMKALRKINTVNTDRLSVINETIHLPLRTDIPERIEELNKQELELLQSLRGTSLNLKTFIPLYIKYNLFPEYPSYYKYRYLQEEKIGSQALKSMDRENHRNIEKYLRNIHAMEKLARIVDNKGHLRNRQEQIDNYVGSTVALEIQGMRIGDFVMVSFPGEVFVEVGLNIKEKSPYENTFLAGYSNGFIYYNPTADAYNGWAYEDMNCILAPEWQAIFEEKVMAIINRF